MQIRRPHAETNICIPWNKKCPLKKNPHEWINLKIHLKTSIFFYDGHINTAAPSSFEYTSKKENRIHCLSTTFSLSRHSHRMMMRKKKRREVNKWKRKVKRRIASSISERDENYDIEEYSDFLLLLMEIFHPFLLSYFLFLWQQKTRIVIFIVLSLFLCDTAFYHCIYLYLINVLFSLKVFFFSFIFFLLELLIWCHYFTCCLKESPGNNRCSPAMSDNVMFLILEEIMKKSIRGQLKQ